MEHDLKQLEELILKTLTLLQDQHPGLSTWNESLVRKLEELRKVLVESPTYCSSHTAMVAYNARRRYNGLSEVTVTVEMTPSDFQESLYVAKAVAEYLNVKLS